MKSVIVPVALLLHAVIFLAAMLVLVAPVLIANYITGPPGLPWPFTLEQFIYVVYVLIFSAIAYTPTTLYLAMSNSQDLLDVAFVPLGINIALFLIATIALFISAAECGSFIYHGGRCL